MNMNEALQLNLIERVAVGDLLRRRARDSAEIEGFIDYSGGARDAWTYARLNARVNRLVRGLRGLGLRQGQRIGLICGNGIDFVTSQWACFKGGMVMVPINYAQSPDDVAWTLQHAGVSALIVEAALWSAFAPANAQLPMELPRIIAGKALEAGYAMLDSLIENQSDAEIEDIVIDDRDTAQIMYTSGTTSKPKGVMTSNSALVFAGFSNAIGYGYSRPFTALSVMPQFHIAAEVAQIMVALLGGRFVCLRGFDAARVVELMETERVSNFVGLPMMWRAMLAVPGVATRDYSALQRCTYAMATMDPETLARLRQTFGVPFDLPGGQTEFTPCPTIHQDDMANEAAETGQGANCWGRPTAVTDQTVLDDEGRELPPGQVGEICWRGPMVMNGYYRNEEATAEVRKFGWHHSGDLGFIDACGELQFVDRKKDIIKSGGENVASAQVEEALLGHGGIAIAAAIGLPHPHWGEAVCAVVQPKPGVELDEAAVLEHCRGRLAGFQAPKRVMILEALPMTATGKIRKAELRVQYADLFSDAAA